MTFIFDNGIQANGSGNPQDIDDLNKAVFPYIQEYVSSNITVVGSLTDTQGVISGFSSDNYATINENIDLTSSSTFEIVFKVITGNTIDTTGNAIMSYYDSKRFAIAINSSAKAELSIGNGSSWVQIIQGTTTIQTNSTYYIKVVYDGTNYKLYLSTDGIAWNKEATYTSTQVIPSMQSLNIGVSRVIDEYVWLGSIDLNSCYIKINNNLVWKGVNTITTTEYDKLQTRFYTKQEVDELITE